MLKQIIKIFMFWCKTTVLHFTIGQVSALNFTKSRHLVILKLIPLPLPYPTALLHISIIMNLKPFLQIF